MLLRSPVIDIVLPATFTAMAFFGALAFVRAEKMDAVGLCLAMFVVGLLWCHAIELKMPNDPDNRDL